MTGANIKKTLEDLASIAISIHNAGVAPYVSGLRFSLDTGALAGSRVSGLEVGSIGAGYLPLDINAMYKPRSRPRRRFRSGFAHGQEPEAMRQYG